MNSERSVPAGSGQLPTPKSSNQLYIHFSKSEKDYTPPNFLRLDMLWEDKRHRKQSGSYCDGVLLFWPFGFFCKS